MTEPHVDPGVKPAVPAPVSGRRLGRLYMTSDLRAATGISRTHLDYYLREQLILPVARTESGYLLFDAAELSVLREIVSMRKSGVPLRQIREGIDR